MMAVCYQHAPTKANRPTPHATVAHLSGFNACLFLQRGWSIQMLAPLLKGSNHAGDNLQAALPVRAAQAQIATQRLTACGVGRLPLLWDATHIKLRRQSSQPAQQKQVLCG